MLTIFLTDFGCFSSHARRRFRQWLVEAAVNPLVADGSTPTVRRQTHQLHVWFPAGIVIGGLISYALTQMGYATVAVEDGRHPHPHRHLRLMFLGQKFPATERVQQGISTGGMYREAIRPLFIVLPFSA